MKHLNCNTWHSVGYFFVARCDRSLPPGIGAWLSQLPTHVSSIVTIFVALIIVSQQKSVDKIGYAWNDHETPVVLGIVQKVDGEETYTRTQNRTHGATLRFLRRYHVEGNEHINSFIRGDGTWVDNCDKLAPFPDVRLLWKWIAKTYPTYFQMLQLRCFV